MDGRSFSESIISCYNEIVHWWQNVFKVPTGKVGNLFVHELACLFQAYADSSAIKSVALYAAMVMPLVLLQRPSKSKDHIPHLERRLSLWLNGDIEALMVEGRVIQERVSRQIHRSQKCVENLPSKFAKLMYEGNVKAAIRLLSDEDCNNGTLSVDAIIDGRTVRNILADKHPPSQPPVSSALISPADDFHPSQPLISSAINDFHPIVFDSLDSELIHSTALKTDGSPGPSGLNAASWKRLCTSFRSSSTELCKHLRLMDPQVLPV